MGMCNEFGNVFLVERGSESNVEWGIKDEVDLGKHLANPAVRRTHMA